MHTSLRIPLLSLVALAVFTSTGQAQLTVVLNTGPRMHASSADLDYWARQGALRDRTYRTRSSCAPTRESSYGSYDYQPAPLHPDLQAAQNFYDKRRIRQAYLDEQKQRKRFTQADVAALREHQQALREIMAINREIAADRAHRAGPGRPEAHELNQITGELYWPGALLDVQFDAGRSRLEEIFRRRARYGADTADPSLEVHQLTQSMQATLKSRIRQLPPQSYTRAKTFLSRIQYESRLSPDAPSLAVR